MEPRAAVERARPSGPEQRKFVLLEETLTGVSWTFEKPHKDPERFGLMGFPKEGSRGFMVGGGAEEEAVVNRNVERERSRIPRGAGHDPLGSEPGE